MKLLGIETSCDDTSVRSNLLMAKPDADDAALWAVLERVALADFLRAAILSTFPK